MANVKNAEDFIVMEFTSGRGAKFEVGYPKSLGYTEAGIKAALPKIEEMVSASSNYKEIKCIPDRSSFISRDAINLGIPAAYVDYDSSAWIYSYRIWFYNTRGWKFIFKDETGDTYSCATNRNGWHYIDYNSKQPTMIGVKES